MKKMTNPYAQDQQPEWAGSDTAQQPPHAAQSAYDVNQQYQQYQQPAPQYSYVPVPTDGFSVAALVLGVLGFNIFAIIFGIIGLNRTSTGAYSGRGMAIAGIVLGALSLAAIIVFVIVLFAVMGAAVGTA